MNSFIFKIGKWIKQSAFGLILTSIAIVFVLCVALLVDSSSDEPVVKVEDSSSISESISVSDSESSQEQQIERILLPFTVDAQIARYFFDPEDTIEIKSQALVSYENKILPSLGVDYTFKDNSFNVLASFTGTVVSKVNDTLYGLTIVVESETGLKAHYSGLSDVCVNLNEQVRQGSQIGVSGENIINADLGNHLHFALQVDDTFINPLKSYNKTLTNVI